MANLTTLDSGSPYARAAHYGAPEYDTEEDGSELEVEQEELSDDITHPFNPDQIKIRTVNIVVDQLISRIKYAEIDMSPDFQRLRGIWRPQQKSRLIESLLLRIPIPVFYVAADSVGKWAVVDGIQRMSTLDDFVNERFPLERLEYLTELKGLTHGALPRAFQRRISETQLIVNVIEPGTPEDVMFNIFVRLNTGGMPLNRQELRHAISPGPVREYLKELAESAEFQKATDNSIRPTRMADRECVLRFLAFHIEPWEDYRTYDLDGYLTHIMSRINGMSAVQRQSFASDFKKAMIAAFAIFGTSAFRKPSGAGGRARGPISRALLEAWSVQLARCSNEQLAGLIDRREELQSRFTHLLESDSDLYNAVSFSTASPERIRRRFGVIQQLVEELV